MCSTLRPSNTKCNDSSYDMQSLTLDVVKLRSVVRLADMMLCGQAVDMLVEGMTSLQTCLHAQSPLLVQAAFTHTSLAFQPSDQLMLKVLNTTKVFFSNTMMPYPSEWPPEVLLASCAEACCPYPNPHCLLAS